MRAPLLPYFKSTRTQYDTLRGSRISPPRISHRAHKPAITAATPPSPTSSPRSSQGWQTLSQPQRIALIVADCEVERWLARQAVLRQQVAAGHGAQGPSEGPVATQATHLHHARPLD